MHTLVKLALPLLCALPAWASSNEWVLSWADEFETSGQPDPTIWGYDLGGGGWGNNEKQIYTSDPENVRVEDGNLVVEVRQEEGSRTPLYTSARIHTREQISIQYGRIEVRAKLPSETGTWAAIWMLSTDALWPAPYWPDNGEIDIVEHVGYEEDPLFLDVKGEPSLPNVHSTLHTGKRNHLVSGGIGSSTYLPTASSAFHVYALEWDPQSIRVFIDGNLSAEFLKATDAGIPVRNPPDETWPWWPFDQRFHLIMNVAVGGNWGGHFRSSFYEESPYGDDGIDDDGVWPQQMLIDYVRVYKSADAAARSDSVPGQLQPENHWDARGVRMELHDDDTSELHFSDVEAADSFSYRANAAAEGVYDVRAQVLGSGPGLVVQNERLDSVTELQPVAPAQETGWRWVSLGSLQLARGLNPLTFTATGSGYAIGAIELSRPISGSWHGFPLDELGVADTGTWLGPVNTKFGPFLWAPRADTWLYLPSAQGGTVSATSQWIFAYAPSQLRPWDGLSAPWFYSKNLNRWFYAPGAPGSADLNAPQWIFLYN